ncbi:MAG: DUF4957 domain-containing protein [Bacteroidales bacterium]|nr:DUF4957 domain-containing protein [Bacteroidales bacterium]
MNKYFYNISLCLCMGALVMGAASCSDPDDVITSVKYDRLFSPTEVSTRVKNRTSVEIAWQTRNERVDQYTIELSTDEAFSSIARSETAAFSPVLIAGLDGETEYFVRIKATAEGIKESKWSPSAKFKTDTENIYKPSVDGDVQATTVTLRWTAGETVETIEVLDQEGNLLKSQPVTADECSEGVATVAGLQGETTYQFVLKRNGKTRGSVTVTTELDLNGATKVTVDDDWYSIFQNAQPGDVFALMPGEYTAYEVDGLPFSSLTLSNSISIKAAKSTDKPVLSGFNFKIGAGVSLDLLNVVLDGKKHADQAFIFTEEGNIDHFVVSGCEISNYVKGFFYLNVPAVVNQITVDNCLIHDIECSGGDFFDSRKGGYNKFDLTNSTIYNSAAKRDIFRYDDASATVQASSIINVDHCTFAKVGNGGANYRIFYVRFQGNSISFTNNIVYDFNNKRGFSEQKNTAEPEFAGNYYCKTLNLLSLEEGNTQAIRFFDTKGKDLASSPFANADNNDFTVTNEDVAYDKAGDPRWIK